jgi:hypothetical protein
LDGVGVTLKDAKGAEPTGYIDVFAGVVDGIPLDVNMLRIEVLAGELIATAAPEPTGAALYLLAWPGFARLGCRC